MEEISEYIINLDRCNQSCLFCMKKADILNYKPVTKKAVFEEIKKAKSGGCRAVDFFGGEPTVFDFLPEAISYAANLGLRCSLATNAVNFALKPYADNFFDLTSGCDLQIRISLHSHLAAVHDRITNVPGSHIRTAAGIKRIIRHTQPTLNVVINSLNYKDLEEIVGYAKSLGAVYIKFSSLVMQGDIMENPWLVVKPSSYMPYLIRAIILARKKGFQFVGVEKLDRRIHESMVEAGMDWVIPCDLV